jgi:predicted permease
MSGFQQFLRRTRALFSRRNRETEMEEEMRLHVEHLARKLTEDGLSPEEARYAAQRRFGGADQFKEQCRDGMGWKAVEDLLRDIRFAGRVLLKNKGFSTVALLTLALCIGANTAIFAAVYGLLIKPLPFRDPSRIAVIKNVFNSRAMDSNLVQYTDYKANAVSYDGVGLWRPKLLTTGEVGSEERVMAVSCTAEMFEILGVSPLIGHFFTWKDCRFGENPLVVLTDSFWRARFNGDPSVLGRTLRVDGEDRKIIGVAPPEIEAFDARVRFIIPLQWKLAWINPTQRYALDTPLYGRLKQNVLASQAQSEAAAIERRFYNAAPDWNKSLLDRSSYRILVEPVQQERVQQITKSLYLLQGGVASVLLIGCVNVANLLLARTNSRQGELAVRLAVGATRGAIARQLIVESLVLTVSGAALGVGGAFASIRTINLYGARMVPGMQPLSIDDHVLGFAIAVTLIVGVVISMLPMAHILRPGLGTLIHGTSRTASVSRGARALSGVLVIGQVSVTLVLLTGAGLLIHSFENAISVKPGFDPENLLAARIALGRPYWNDHGAVFQKQLIQALKEIPGVSGVAIADGIPFEGGLSHRVLTLKDSLIAAESVQPNAFEVGVSVGYFEALHIQLVEGRFFNDRDTDGHEYVVDERFAKAYFPGRSAVGAHFTFQNRSLPAKAEDWPVIVGVVRNVAHNGVEDRSNTPFTYYPILNAQPEEPNLFVRSTRPTDDLIATVRDKLHTLDPGIPLYHIERMQTAIEGSFTDRRAVMLLISGFAILALFLSALGLYGVLAFDVSQRTREIGIRSAIGATRWEIVGLIMRQGLWRTGIGLVIGITSAILLCRLMVGMLFELKPSDPWTLFSVSLLLAAIAALASYLPARRAARIDPVQALRIE